MKATVVVSPVLINTVGPCSVAQVIFQFIESCLGRFRTELFAHVSACSRTFRLVCGMVRPIRDPSKHQRDPRHGPRGGLVKMVKIPLFHKFVGIQGRPHDALPPSPGCFYKKGHLAPCCETFSTQTLAAPLPLLPHFSTFLAPSFRAGLPWD